MKKTVITRFIMVVCIIVSVALTVCSCDLFPKPETKVTYTITVVDENDQPLAGASVQLCNGNNCENTVLTDESGVATIELVAADYTVVVSLDGYIGEDQYNFAADSTKINVTLALIPADPSDPADPTDPSDPADPADPSDPGDEEPTPEEGTTAENPVFIMFDDDGNATVTVPAGATYYFASRSLTDDAVLKVNGTAVEFTSGALYNMFGTFTITNSSSEAVEYTLYVSYVVGDFMNPEVIEELDSYYGEISQAQGEEQGYYYTWIAPADGTATFYFDSEGTPEGYICDIIISNLNTFAQRTLLEDGVDDNGMKVTIDVKKGNTLRINVTAIKDADGNYYPAADMTWIGNFSYPA